MKIKINHLAKMEGHASFVADILDGNVKEAMIKTEEGARLIEGVLRGRYYSEAPIITARICGICPVVHVLAAIKALESAFGVKPKVQTIALRKVMELAQIVHSHTLHLFFLSLPDFLGYRDDIKMAGKYPKEAQKAMEIREWALKVLEIIAGRAIHPLAAQVGGFKKWPSQEGIQKLLQNSDKVLKKSLDLAELFKKLKYPDLNNKTEYLALGSPKEYAIYDGDIVSSKGAKVSANRFMHKIEEIEKPYQLVKRNKWQGKPFMVGAIARLNLHHQQLNPRAKKFLKTTGLKLPTDNPFHNVLAQAVEVVHCLEEIIQILRQSKISYRSDKAVNVRFKARAGKGVGAVEAPRGTLYHYYEIGRNGYIKDCNIITPTAQFLTNLEADLAAYLPKTLKISDSRRRQEIKKLIRAYDPCISCATH